MLDKVYEAQDDIPPLGLVLTKKKKRTEIAREGKRNGGEKFVRRFKVD